MLPGRNALYVLHCGQGSFCAVVTVPPCPEIDVDGSRVGVSPMAFVHLKHGDASRTITVKMAGHKTVEKQVVPDGKIIPIGFTHEPN